MAAPKAFLMFFLMIQVISAQLTPNFYQTICPEALPTIKRVVSKAIRDEPRMGASLLRLHFHDCFVNGCDGSILLDDTSSFTGEKTAAPNLNSVRGFEVVDKIKSAVDKACNASVVSCADILAVASRDSVSFLGGPQFWYQIPVGRRDGRTASISAANNNLPPPFFSFSQLLSSFQSTCPPTGGDNNLKPLDQTPAWFNTDYYSALVRNRGLLHSDQELFGTGNSASDRLVMTYSTNPFKFAADFAASMVKMGNIQVVTGTDGEVRKNCRVIN
ncbi:Cationic peroxidase 1 [Linum perenne]